MDLESADIVVVEIVRGLGSGVLGAIWGASNRRRRFFFFLSTRAKAKQA